MGAPRQGRVAVVLKGYPRLSETFIAQEIAALEQRGLEILIVSLRHPTDDRTHPVHAEIRAPRLYLPEYLYQEPLRVLRAWWRMRGCRAYRQVRNLWLKDLRRDPTPNRGRRFGQALVLASELPGDVTHLHVHFLHTPASVTRYAAALRGLPWSGSAHAKDIWTTPDWEKREKLQDCKWLVTCTAANFAHLAALAPQGRVELVYHGIDLNRFPPPPPAPPRERNGAAAEDPVIVLSVGRLVEKKGVDVLLWALALLPRSLNWRFVHVGGGPLRRALEARARALGVAERVTWRGALSQQQLLEEYRAADLFALASRIARDGDRDGLPNVLMEAQSQDLPCLATSVSGIPELVEPDVTGVLVAPESPEAFAGELEALICNPARRRALGQAGRARVAARFGLESNILRLAEKFGLREGPETIARAATR
ncbi:MAG: colanic acid biosynthesis glycosyltransferase WcaL [Betaproteobacteria bacterium RIFCSPLOWO2_02_FULL_68_150]|nr:MAG: colanic acid biosynthesis glycosyltransferase WcaL [Betaproteobacteria bacterium RIFCSPLOWO2_02_FULL_68_150]